MRYCVQSKGVAKRSTYCGLSRILESKNNLNTLKNLLGENKCHSLISSLKKKGAFPILFVLI